MRRSTVFTARGMVRRGLSGQAGRSDGRKLAEKLAAQRRAKQEARMAAGEDLEGGVSLAGFYAAAGIVGAAGVSYLAFSDEGSKWFDQHVYKGTPIGAAGDFIKKTFFSSFQSFVDPVAEKLLPDATTEGLPPGMAPLRTLVVDFEDTLVHLEWDRKNGWRAVKRPGVDQFLRRLYQNWEIVLFTRGFRDFLMEMIAGPGGLDPYGLIQHRLFREATTYVDGEHVKDLSHLNRDLARVVAIDDNPKALQLQPENLITVPAFTDPYKPDRALLDLIPFLEDIVDRNVKDIREELKKYKGKDIGQAFAEELQQRRKNAPPTKGGVFSGLFGGPAKPIGSSAGGAAPAPSPEMDDMLVPALDIRMTPLSDADKLPEGQPAGGQPIPPSPADVVAQEAPPQASSPAVGSFWGSVVKK